MSACQELTAYRTNKFHPTKYITNHFQHNLISPCFVLIRHFLETISTTNCLVRNYSPYNKQAKWWNLTTDKTLLIYCIYGDHNHLDDTLLDLLFQYFRLCGLRIAKVHDLVQKLINKYEVVSYTLLLQLLEIFLEHLPDTVITTIRTP